MRFSKIINLFLIISSVVVGLGLSELFCRRNISETNFSLKYGLFEPNLRKVFKPTEDIMPGIFGESKFFTNSYGLRGDELSEKNEYRMLLIGGSVVESLYVDQEKTWPALLQELLRMDPRFKNVWVGNAGKSGLNSRDHVVQERILLDELPKIDMVMVVAGINDLTVALSETDHGNLSEKDLEKRVFEVNPHNDKILIPTFKRTSKIENCFWCLFRLKGLYSLSKPKNIQDDAGIIYKTWRDNRKNASKIIDDLPDLTDSLLKYSENLNTIIDIAQKKSVRTVLVTQPALWKESMSEEEENLLWLGGKGNFLNITGLPYYSPKALDIALGMYNKTMLSVCEKRGVYCLDLAGLIPKDSTLFYDDAHFNDKGSSRTADIVYQFMTKLEL